MRLGSHHTEESLAKIAAAKKGHPLSVETRVKMSLAARGKHPTFETRVKLSTAQEKRITSPETRVKQSEAHRGNNYRLGYHWSSEMKAKLSAVHWRGGSRVCEAKKRAKRRLLGFNPLNSIFLGSEAHHINSQDVVHIPKVLHQSVKHCLSTWRNMEKINTLAGQYLTEDWT